MTPRVLLAAAALAAASGCAGGATTMYHWDGYDQRLYQHYKHPQDRDAWVQALREIVREADEEGRRVPPGMCAELGWALLEEGLAVEAVAWFRREQAQWPESRELMEKLVRNAERRGPPPPAKGPAGATEEVR